VAGAESERAAEPAPTRLDRSASASTRFAPACPATAATSATMPQPATVVVARVGRGDRPQWCSIMFAIRQEAGEFQVVEVQRAGLRRVIARSQPFRVPIFYRASLWHQIPNRGKPRRAHNALIEWLTAAGWRQIDTRGRWHDTAFARTDTSSPQVSPERVPVGSDSGR
jgi:hypothetical protein